MTFAVLLDPYTYIYENAAMTLDGDPYKLHTGQYSTDLIANRSVEFLGNAIESDEPFFLGIAPIAPHAELIDKFKEPIPADRHRDLFPNAKVPRKKNFNPCKVSAKLNFNDCNANGRHTQPGSASYFSKLPRLDARQVAYLDNFQRRRLQSLQAVDDLINEIMAVLEDNPDVLENTYLIYTSDNGYHLGQHRLPPGKTCNIEEDINVPFLARGPGISKGKTVSFPKPRIHTKLSASWQTRTSTCTLFGA